MESATLYYRTEDVLDTLTIVLKVPQISIKLMKWMDTERVVMLFEKHKRYFLFFFFVPQWGNLKRIKELHL